MSETSSTIERCVQLLEVISELGTASPHELALRLDASRSSVQRLLNTLLHRGFVIRTANGFGLATYVRALSDVALRSLRSASYNVSRELADACHETVVLYVADGDDAIVIDEAVTTTEQPMQVRHPVGTRTPLASGAGGLAYLAYARPNTRARLAAAEGEGLSKRLAEIREAGYIVQADSHNGRICEIAVPVVDAESRAVASLAILAPVSRSDALSAQLPRLREGAARIVAVRRNDDENRAP